jgi:hypothetical protein
VAAPGVAAAVKRGDASTKTIEKWNFLETLVHLANCSIEVLKTDTASIVCLFSEGITASFKGLSSFKMNAFGSDPIPEIMPQ